MSTMKFTLDKYDFMVIMIFKIKGQNSRSSTNLSLKFDEDATLCFAGLFVCSCRIHKSESTSNFKHSFLDSNLEPTRFIHL